MNDRYVLVFYFMIEMNGYLRLGLIRLIRLIRVIGWAWTLDTSQLPLSSHLAWSILVYNHDIDLFMYNYKEMNVLVVLVVLVYLK